MSIQHLDLDLDLDQALSDFGAHARTLATGAEPVALPEIRRRARFLRRKRRTIGLASCASVLAIGALVATATIAQVSGPLVTTAQAGDPCGDVGGYTSEVPAERLGKSLQLPGKTEDLELHSAYPRQTSPVCPLQYPLVVAYTSNQSDGRLTAGITLWRNMPDEYLDPNMTGEVAADIVDATVRGHEGKLLSFHDHPGHRLSWRDSNGTPWLVEAAGMSGKGLIAMVDALRIKSETTKNAEIDSSSLPDGMKVATMPERDKPNGISFSATYAKPGTKGWTHEDDPTVDLSVDGATMPIEHKASIYVGKPRIVDYQGVRYYVDTTMPRISIMWNKGGQSFWLTVSKKLMGTKKALAIAASVAPADPSRDDLAKAIELPKELAKRPIAPEDMVEAG